MGQSSVGWEDEDFADYQAGRLPLAPEGRVPWGFRSPPPLENPPDGERLSTSPAPPGFEAPIRRTHQALANPMDEARLRWRDRQAEGADEGNSKPDIRNAEWLRVRPEGRMRTASTGANGAGAAANPELGIRKAKWLPPRTTIAGAARPAFAGGVSGEALRDGGGKSGFDPRNAKWMPRAEDIRSMIDPEGAAHGKLAGANFGGGGSQPVESSHSFAEPRDRSGTATDEATAERERLLAERVRMRGDGNGFPAPLASERQEIEEAGRRLAAYGETPALYGRRLLNLGQGIEGKGPDEPVVRRYREELGKWREWQAANPGYLAARGELGAAVDRANERAQAMAVRNERVISAMLDPESSRQLAQRPQELAAAAQPRISAEGDVDPMEVDRMAARSRLGKRTTPTLATLAALYGFKQRGARTVGGRPIDEQIAAVTPQEPPMLDALMKSEGFRKLDGSARVDELKKWVDENVKYARAVDPGFDEAKEKEFRGQFVDRGGFWGSLRELGTGLVTALLDRFPSDLARIARGFAGGPKVGGKAWYDQWIAEQKEDEARRGTSYQVLAGHEGALALSEGPKSTVTSLATGVAGQVVGGLGGALLGVESGPGLLLSGAAGAFAGSSAAFYQMAKDQFLEQVQEKYLKGHPGASEEDWQREKIARHIDEEARKVGLWEAGTEGLSAAFFAGMFKAGRFLLPGVAKALAKEAAETTLKKAATLGLKLGASAAEEVVGETAASYGQGASEARVGLREAAPTVGESFGEARGPAAVGALLQGGVGAILGGGRGPQAPQIDRTALDRVRDRAAKLTQTQEQARSAREQGDMAAAARLDEEAGRQVENLHEDSVAARRALPAEGRRAMAKLGDSQADVEKNEAALASDPTLHFASAEIGRALRQLEPKGKSQMRDAAARRLGVPLEIGRYMSDQHAGLAAVQDLKQVARGESIDPVRARVLESLGLIERPSSQAGQAASSVGYRVTDDALPLFPMGWRKAMGAKPGTFHIAATPGETGDLLGSLVRAGQRRLAKAYGSAVVNESASSTDQAQRGRRFDAVPIIAEFAKSFGKVFARGVVQTREATGSAGLWVSSDGQQFGFNLEELAATLRSVPAGQQEAKLRAMLDEELRHVADVRVNSDTSTAELWESLPSEIQNAAKAIYTRENPGDALGARMSAVQWGREFKRMLSQEISTGQVSEVAELAAAVVASAREGKGAQTWVGRLLAHIRKMIGWLNSHEGREATLQLRALDQELARIRRGESNPAAPGMAHVPERLAASGSGKSDEPVTSMQRNPLGEVLRSIDQTTTQDYEDDRERHRRDLGRSIENAAREQRRSRGAGAGDGNRAEGNELGRVALENVRRLDETAIIEAGKRGILSANLGRNEHQVYHVPGSGRALKITKEGEFGASGSWLEYLRRIELNNRLWDDDMRLEGVLVNPATGRWRAVVSQPWIEGAKPASVPEVTKYFKALGFTRVSDRGFWNSGREILVNDAEPVNVLMGSDGKVYPIDVIPQTDLSPSKVEMFDRIAERRREDGEDSGRLHASANRVDENGVHSLAKPRQSLNLNSDEKRKDPAFILEALIRGSHEAGGPQRWKLGRAIASYSRLLAWAERSALRFDPASLPPGKERGGGEHVVRYDPQSGRWYKLTKPGLFGAQSEDAGAYLQRWALANRVFGDDVKFEGIVTLPGEHDARTIISQPDVAGRDSTTAEIERYLRERGFHQVDRMRWVHPVTGLAVWDAHTEGNAITMADGKVRPIDLQIEPASPAELRDVRRATGMGGESLFASRPIDSGEGAEQSADAKNHRTGSEPARSIPVLDPEALRSPEAKIRNLAKAWQRFEEIVAEGRTLNSSQLSLRKIADRELGNRGLLTRTLEVESGGLPPSNSPSDPKASASEIGGKNAVVPESFRQQVHPLVRDLIKLARTVFKQMGTTVVDEVAGEKAAAAFPGPGDESYVILNIDKLIERAYIVSDGYPKHVGTIVAGVIREEIIHSAYIKALRELWKQGGNIPSDFRAHYLAHTRAIAKELVALRERLRATGRHNKLNLLEEAVAASWLLYGHKGGNTPDAIFEKLRSEPNTGFRFSVELIRQLVELNRDGSLTNEIRYSSLMGKLAEGLKAALAALRAAWSNIKKGELNAPLLRQAVGETGRVLAEAERSFPASIAPFDNDGF
jgi:hypothetical protein